MRQTFTVTSPASALSLLSTEQLRSAAGLDAADSSQDAELLVLGAAISTEIAVACNVADDGIHPPTLCRETVSETFWGCGNDHELFLSRRFVSSIVSVVEAGSTLTSTGHVLNAGAGLLNRVMNGRPWAWYAGETTVTYVAGFDSAPPDLAAAAIDLVRLRLSSASRDPLVKSESIEVPDIQTRRLDFWVGALPGAASSPVPPDILARLARYVNLGVA